MQRTNSTLKMISMQQDEQGGAAGVVEPEEGAAEKTPATYTVGEEDLTVDELVDRAKSNAVNTQHAQENADNLRLVETQRTEMTAREARVKAREDKVADSLVDVVTARQTERGTIPTETVEDWRESWERDYASIDLLTDPEASEKQATLLREKSDLEAQERQNEQAALREEFATETKASEERATRSADDKSRAHDVNANVDKRNETTFNDTLAEEFTNTPLTAEERDEVWKHYTQKLGASYGGFPAGATKWQHNAKAVIDAVWSTLGVRDRMINAREATARSQGVGAHVNGQEASASTPNNARPAVLSTADQAFRDKLDIAENIKRTQGPAALDTWAREGNWTKDDSVRFQKMKREREVGLAV